MDCYYEWRKHIRALLLENYFPLLHLILAWNHKGWDCAVSFSVLAQIFTGPRSCWLQVLRVVPRQSCLTQFLNTGHGIFSCSDTETKPTTGFGEEEGRSESHPVRGVWEVTAQNAALSGSGADSCQVSCHLKTGPVCVRPQVGQPKSKYHSGRFFFSCRFSYIIINPITRWWGLVLRLKIWVPESLDFLLLASYKHYSKTIPMGMTCYTSPDLTQAYIAFSWLEYVILIYLL